MRNHTHKNKVFDDNTGEKHILLIPQIVAWIDVCGHASLFGVTVGMHVRFHSKES